MKLQASAQNPFSLQNPLPLVGHWDNRTTRRSTFAIKPFAFEDTDRLADQTDAAARKQEIICAVILGLCLLFTVAVCLSQLARL